MHRPMKKLVLVVMLAWAGIASAQMREREILRERPSGFWTSNRPAEGGAYKWRLLGIGVAIAGVMGIVVIRVMRSARNSREQRIRSDQH